MFFPASLRPTLESPRLMLRWMCQLCKGGYSLLCCVAGGQRPLLVDDRGSCEVAHNSPTMVLSLWICMQNSAFESPVLLFRT